jgi:hypothetical protein
VLHNNSAFTTRLSPVRWPDLLVAYYAPSRILFSSKLFSAHVSPPEVGGWGPTQFGWPVLTAEGFAVMVHPTD